LACQRLTVDTVSLLCTVQWLRVYCDWVWATVRLREHTA